MKVMSKKCKVNNDSAAGKKHQDTVKQGKRSKC